MKIARLIAGLAVAAGFAGAALAFIYSLPLDFRETSPVQPLPFNHKLHAGDNGIDCLYCHRFAPRSAVAGIPAVSDCRDCHRFISLNAPDIKKLLDYGERRQPIPWVRVHTLPDHVYFPHMMHYRAGLDCATCHGDVAAMQRTTRSTSLKMGWCLNCHRRHRASIDCWTCHI